MSSRAARWSDVLSKNKRSKDGAAALYDSWAEEYDATLSEWNYKAPKMCAKLLAKSMEASNAVGPILDVGCGTGMVGKELVAAGITRNELWGCDLSAKSLEVAMKKGMYSKLFHQNLEMVLGCRDRCFAGIICVGVLTYVSEEGTSRLFEEWDRICANGAIIVFSQKTGITRHEAIVKRFSSEGKWKLIKSIMRQRYYNDDTTA